MARPLEERIRSDTAKCIQRGLYRRRGIDDEGFVCSYCTYFFLNSQQDPGTCAYLGEITRIRKEINGFYNYMEFYICKRRKRYKIKKEDFP